MREDINPESPWLQTWLYANRRVNQSKICFSRTEKTPRFSTLYMRSLRRRCQ
jgi:hypothetical protein